MTDLIDFISEYIRNDPLPYKIQTSWGEYRKTSCFSWKLPFPSEGDKSLLQINSELENRLFYLLMNSPTSEEINEINKKREQLLSGVKFTKMYGMRVITTNDLLKMDRRKGIRKEWWELHQQVEDNHACLFIGYNLASQGTSDEADELILMPDRDQCNFLRLHNTQGNNYSIGTEEIIGRIKKLGDIIDVHIISATSDTLELFFGLSDIKGKTSKVKYQLQKMCPDIEDLSAAMRLGRVKIWWD